MIYFVGMHNKPGFEPLDSRTYSGKIIDEIIKQITCSGVVKTNLANVEFLPEQALEHAIDWHHRYSVSPDDTIVLLGRWVQKNFLRNPEHRHIEAAHPAAFKVRANPTEYVKRIAFHCNFK